MLLVAIITRDSREEKKLNAVSSALAFAKDETTNVCEWSNGTETRFKETLYTHSTALHCVHQTIHWSGKATNGREKKKKQSQNVNIAQPRAPLHNNAVEIDSRCTLPLYEFCPCFFFRFFFSFSAVFVSFACLACGVEFYLAWCTLYRYTDETLNAGWNDNTMRSI